ncbi:hypothetical protein, conserved [Eimeria tenella]|uniref:Transmembrane protein n=1 Tax=Eimeria tenella TaxID=5802 RepID=U6L144_EIMTE|nr:hypothetical protein, conserved [Eimeria tenella]CDJ42324.1 hypothetical protein, conserved [Eimeria tenella]|eukprot:XP_013233074.1 hypothetical protein, conserved [Eimeria tenella]
MSSAAGTRRSLLHDVLSHAEVVELGLDGSIEDLPPLTTRWTPSCAWAVLAFCWGYFLFFWSAAALALRSVLQQHPDTLLPGCAELAFAAACSGLLVAAEFALYCYVKAKNAVASSSGPMGSPYTPTRSCVFSHFGLSALSRICCFLQLFFLLHSRLLPVPMFACAAFTVSLTERQLDSAGENPQTGSPFVSPRAALALTNCLFFLDLPGITLHVKASFLPLEQLEAHEFLASLVSLVRLYSGDFCMLLYLIFALCTFGGNVLFFMLLTFLLLKLKASCVAALLAHVASVFGIWDAE